MHKALENTKECLKDELKDLVKKEKRTPADIECMGEIVDMLKDIATIEGMEDFFDMDEGGNYSGRSYAVRMPHVNRGMDGHMPYGDGMSGRRGRSVTTGRYVSRDYRPSPSREYRGDGYSGHEMPVEDRMVGALEPLMNSAGSEHERMRIQEAIDMLESRR